MNKNVESIAPENYSSVCPYLMVESVEDTLDFLTKVFNAKKREGLKTPDGFIVHGTATIYEVTIMLGRTSPEYSALPGMNYIFTDDVDKTYNKALEYGAKSLMKPANQFYGFRECGVEDPQGNQWWIAKKFEHVEPEEIQRRLHELNDD